MNACLRSDGTSGTFTSPELYHHRMAAGALYRVELARQLELRLGLVAEKRGIFFELRGVCETVMRYFSKRRREIERVLDEKGFSSARAAEVAALNTRSVKEHVARQELFRRWREEGRENGWDAAAFLAANREAKGAREHAAEPREVRVALAVKGALEELTDDRAHFPAHELVRKVAEHAQGTGLSVKEVLAAVEDCLRERLVSLSMHKGYRHYTTPEMLALEEDLLARAGRMRARKMEPTASEETIAEVLAKYDFLNPSQKKAVRSLASERRQIAGLRGMAGTGKTTMLKAVAEALTESGLTVLGAALSGKAAEGLESGAEIPSRTLASLLLSIERSREEFDPSEAGAEFSAWVESMGESRTRADLPRFDLERSRRRFAAQRPSNPLDANTVLVIDEAGMVGTRQFARVLKECEQAGTRVILVGDAKQLQPIEAGGPFRALAQRFEFCELTEIIRQREPWKRRAVHAFSEGEAGPALAAYAERGLVSVATDRVASREALLEEWSGQGVHRPADHFILAGTRKDVAILNREIQSHRRAAGVLSEKFVEVGSEHLFEGDRVLFTRNAATRGLRNGHMGTLEKVEGQNLTVRLDHNQRRVSVPLTEYDHLQLGYAATTHKAQGMTAENVYVLTDESMQDRHLSYVQASRGRAVTRFYTSRDEAGPDFESLTRSMSRSREKVLASELRSESPAGEGRTRGRDRSRNPLRP